MRRSTGWRKQSPRSTDPRSGRRFPRLATLSILFALVAGACAPRRPPPALFPDGPPEVRVGIAVDTTEVAIGASSGLSVTDAATGTTIGRLPAGETAVVRATDAGLVLDFDGRESASTNAIVARPDAGGMITIDGTPYRGFARIHPRPSGRLTAVNVVGMEDYLLGVVPYEIGRVGPELLEASRAQAVAARTYAVRYLGRREALGFDVFATVDDQVYGGAEGEHEPVSQAVRTTAGEILTYDGEPIEAFYHSTCAGQTAAIEEVWDEDPRPYLRSVVDVDPATGLAFDSTSNRFRWSVTWSADELRDILNQTLADSLPAAATGVGELLGFETLALTPSGRIRTLRISTSAGTFDVGGDRIRWIFLTPEGNILNSSKFELIVDRDDQNRIREITAEGMGWGHGIGMCQVGAMGRARAGQDYRTILSTYYPGTRITRAY